MKTTLDLRDDLLANAKALAARERTSLTKMIEEALALRMRRKGFTRTTTLRDLPRSRNKGGLRPGIDGASNRSLFDAADE